MIKRFLALVFAFVLAACVRHADSPSPHEGEIRIVHPQNPRINTLVVDAYIDVHFKSAEVEKLKAGLEAINWMLNGVERFDVKDTSWAPPASDDVLDEDQKIVVDTEKTLTVAQYNHIRRYSHTSQAMPEGLLIRRVALADAEDGVLGWVPDLGDLDVFLVADRQPHLVQLVFEHEMMHALGAPHNAIRGSLMYPYISEGSSSSCPDEMSVRSLENRQLLFWSTARARFNPAYLNYCLLTQ